MNHRKLKACLSLQRKTTKADAKSPPSYELFIEKNPFAISCNVIAEVVEETIERVNKVIKKV